MSAVTYDGMPIKKQLAYSPLTDQVFWVDGKGNQTNITQQFLAMIEVWATNDNINGGNVDRSFSSSRLKVNVQIRKTEASGTGQAE